MDYLVRWVDEDKEFGFSKCDFYDEEGAVIGTLYLTSSERQLFRDLGCTFERMEWVTPWPLERDKQDEADWE